MGKYRKKPVVIEAMQFTGHNYPELSSWMGEAAINMHSPADTLTMYIETLEGTMRADVDDWIIRGVEGEFYPCKPDIFAKTYEEAQADRTGAPSG